MAIDMEMFRELSVLNDIADNELEIILSKLSEVKYKKNSLIFLEGEPGKFFYFIFKGLIKLSKVSNDGQEKIIQILKTNDIIGEVVLFDGGNYPTTAEVIEDCLLGRIKCSDFINIINNNPNIANNFLKVMSIRLRQAQRQIRNLALKDAYGRLASRLFKLSRDHGVENDKGIVIEINLSNQEIAKLVGTSRETVSRILNEFKRKNIIDINQQKITIINMKKLKSWM